MTGWKRDALTGNQRYRIGLFGRLILQVEQYEVFDGTDCNGEVSPWHGDKRTIWRDAKVQDMQGPSTIFYTAMLLHYFKNTK